MVLFCSPPLAPSPSLLFSRNRDSWASTKGFFSATAGRGISGATRESWNSIPPFLASLLRPRNVARSEKKREERAGKRRRRENRKRVSTTFGPVTLLKTQGDFVFYRVLPFLSSLTRILFLKAKVESTSYL